MCLGIPARIIDIADRNQEVATVDIGGVKRDINITCIINEGFSADSYIGRWVLVHAGLALDCIDPEEAERTLERLDELTGVRP